MVELAPLPEWVRDLARAAPSSNGKDAAHEIRVAQGARNTTAASLAGTMRRRGMSYETIVVALQADNDERFDPPLGAAEIERVARSVSRYPPEDVPRNPRAILAPGGIRSILVTGRQDADILHDARSVLAALEDPAIYRHPSGHLLRVRDDALRQMSRGEVHDLLAKHARWERATQGGKICDAAVPRRLLEPLVEAPSAEFRVVRRIVPVPAFVGPDLRLVTEPDFDQETETLFHGDAIGVPSIPEIPSSDNITDARDILDSWLREFPFADSTARAHCIALLLTLLIRQSIDGCIPMFLIEAATPGTGKTTLAEVLCSAAHGVPPVSTAYTRDGEEMGKRAASWILSGRPVAFLDDVSRITGDPAHVLSSLITTGALEVRAMRELRTAGGKWDGTLIATGNNVGLAEEMPRKICRIRLDSPENPATRRFKRQDLHAWTVENRPRIIWAMGVLIRAWQAVDSPAGTTVRPGFGRFSQVIGGILGCLDRPLANAFLSEDELADMMSFGEGMDELRSFVDSWIGTKVPPGGGFRAKDLVAVAERASVLEGLMGDGNDRSRSSRLGHYLKRQRGKVVSGHRIVGTANASAGSTLWRLVSVREESP
jgi:hypothetical protein